jgi:cobalt/nickel transport system permease protein
VTVLAPLAAPADTLIERLAPRTRLVVALGCVLAITALATPGWSVAALAGAGALVLLARLQPGAVARRLLRVEGFLVALLLLLPFTVPGEPLLAIGPLAASREGLLRALLLVVKINACVLACTALLGTLEPVRLGRALAGLGAPLRLVHLFLFVVRYVALFDAELHRLREAMRARGFVARSGRHGWRTLGNLAGMLLVRALDRAERVDEAMRCRGFAGRLPLLAGERLAGRDLRFAGCAGALALLLLAGDRLW